MSSLIMPRLLERRARSFATTTHTQQLLRHLRALTWDSATPMYHTHLPRTQPALPPEFYRMVRFVNTLTIAGSQLYHALPADSVDRAFLNFFMGNAYASESFIWNQPGVMQCYYYEGLSWQRGTIVDPALDPFSSVLPIRSSAVLDCLLGLVLKYSRTPNVLYWLGAEQQNTASTQLFRPTWCWPVTTPSNPIVFRNVVHPSMSHPHRFVFGPSTWLAMTHDIVDWNSRRYPTRDMQACIEDGRARWQAVDKYLHVNAQLLQQLPSVADDRVAGEPATYRDTRVSFLAPHGPAVTRCLQLTAPVYAIAHGHTFPAPLHRLTPSNAKHTLRSVSTQTRAAAENAHRPRTYNHHLAAATREIQRFYCNRKGTACVFVDPRVRAA
jgi:hypothetical protein